MKPFNQRTPDTQYHDVLQKIVKEGTTVHPIQGEESRMIIGAQMRWHMDNGFPLVTERDLSKLMKGALSEHFAFIHGARTQAELLKWGCKWWDKWVTPAKCATFGLEAGDLGPGSYGPALAAFPTAEGVPFDQIAEVIQQIKDMPASRTHVITTWIPQYAIQHKNRKRRVVVAPCHATLLHFLVFPETKEISLHHVQRSGDMPVGVAFNIIQYAAMLLMVGQVTSYRPRELVYTVSDAHIYESQYGHVEELLSREPRRLPTVTLDPSIKNIRDFRPEHFTISDYDPHPAMTIPTPV